jgi:hypothetical protein
MADATPALSFLGKFLVLKGAARELWLTFFIKFLSVAAYAVMNLTIKLWLSQEFGFFLPLPVRGSPESFPTVSDPFESKGSRLAPARSPKTAVPAGGATCNERQATPPSRPPPKPALRAVW